MQEKRPEKEQKKSAQTRARILDAAAQVLSSKGYAATRLSDVATIAQVQAPAIYYYFDSRDDLVEEVMRKGAATTREAVEAALRELGPSANSLDRVDTAIRAHLAVTSENSQFATAAIRNAGQLSEELRVTQRMEERRYALLWDSLIAAAQAEGHVAAGVNHDFALQFILGSLNSATTWWTPEWGSLDDLTISAQRFMRGGLQQGAAQAPLVSTPSNDR